MKKNITIAIQGLLFTFIALFLASCSSESLVEMPTPKTPPPPPSNNGDISFRQANSDVLQAEFSGEQLLPPVQTDASGIGYFVIGNGEEYFKYGIHVTKLGSATAANFYMAPYGQTGAMIASIPIVDLPETPYTGELCTGLITADDLMGPLAGDMQGLIAALKLQEVYVVIHTLQNPSGELRGQIKY